MRPRSVNDASVKMTGATLLGSLMESEDIYAGSMIVAMSVETEQARGPMPIAAAVAWLRHGKQILELSDMVQFQGGESIATANDIVEKWVNAFFVTGQNR